MLNFSDIARPRRVIVPILGKEFTYNRKRYRVTWPDDGWFQVELSGNHVMVIGPAIPNKDKDLEGALGYTVNNNLVFKNSDIAKRRWGLGPVVPLYFNRSQTFEAASVIVWEDRRAYWLEPDYIDVRVMEVKALFDEEKDLTGEKSITPELRSVFVFHALEREQAKQIALEAKEKEDHERMMRDIPYRLQVTLSRAGAEYVTHSLSGNRIVVDWRIPGSDYRYNSVLDARTWMIVEAGICMSGDDARHNLTSLVKTAELYEEENLIHVTRYT